MDIFLSSCCTRAATSSRKFPGVMLDSSSVQTRDGIEFFFMYSVVFGLAPYPPVPQQETDSPSSLALCGLTGLLKGENEIFLFERQLSDDAHTCPVLKIGG